MAIFLVTPLAENYTAIKAAIEGKTLDYLEVQNSMGFLVSFPGTSVELSNTIGITRDDPSNVRGDLGAALVTLVGSYYGLANTYTWEWMKSRLEKGG